MIELKLPKPEEAITDQITNDSFVGIDFGGVTGKAIVIKTDAMEYTGLIMTLDVSTNWVKESKKEYAEAVLRNGWGKVFVFDNLSELMAWWNYSTFEI